MHDRLATATRETFASFRVRNFRLFFLGQGISQVGNWLTLIAQSLLVLDLTGSGVAVGFLAACQFGPVLLLGAWAGLVADRSDKRRLLLIVQVVAMAQSFALGALAFMDDPPLAALFAVASVGGLCMAFDNPARRVLRRGDGPRGPGPQRRQPEQRHDDQLPGHRAGAGRPAHHHGGLRLGVRRSTALSYVAVLISLGLMRTEELRPSPAAARGKGQVREGLRYVRATPVLAVPLVMMAVVGTLAFNFQVTLPLIVTRTFDQSKATFTILFSVISVGSLIGALWTARRRSIGVTDVVRASLGFGIALLAFALAPNIWLGLPARGRWSASPASAS